MNPMEAFFDAMTPFFEGQSTASEVEQKLGPSPSGTRRLAFYGDLVERQRLQLLRHLFPGVVALCEQHRAGLWEHLARSFTKQHPPTHWEPNAFGQPFGAFLEEQRAHTPDLPAYLEELADYYWIEHRVTVASRPDPDDGLALEHTLFVRHYRHDIRGFALAFSRGERPAPPSLAPQSLMIARSRVTERLFVLHAAVASFVVLGRRLGQIPAGAVPPGLDEHTITAAEKDLVRWGLLAPRAS